MQLIELYLPPLLKRCWYNAALFPCKNSSFFISSICSIVCWALITFTTKKKKKN